MTSTAETKMNRIDISNTVEAICRDVLDNAYLKLEAHQRASEIDNWDSLAHISIITSIEKHYRIRFALGELDSMDSIGDLLDMIARKTTAN